MTRQEFFYYNAGSSHDPLTETPDEGRVRGAMQLAEAEAYAQEQGWTFEWDHDSEGDDANDEACQLWSSDGTKVLASLFGITGATDDYRRVVEAELALQAMGWPAKATQKPQEAAAAPVTEADVHNLIAQALRGRAGVTVSQDGTLDDPSMYIEFPGGQVFFIHATKDEE